MTMRNILIFIKIFDFINKHGELVPISRLLRDFGICFFVFSETAWKISFKNMFPFCGGGPIKLGQKLRICANGRVVANRKQIFDEQFPKGHQGEAAIRYWKHEQGLHPHGQLFFKFLALKVLFSSLHSQFMLNLPSFWGSNNALFWSKRKTSRCLH